MHTSDNVLSDFLAAAAAAVAAGSKLPSPAGETSRVEHDAYWA